MKAIKIAVAFFLLCGSTTSTTAWAGHGHARVGVYIGAPMFWPRYYSSPFYGPFYDPFYGPVYSPPTIITAPAPEPIYIEKGVPQPADSQPSSNVWYYCNKPDGYYPYVKECPEGWQKVVP